MRTIYILAFTAFVAAAPAAHATIMTNAIDNATVQPAGPRTGTNGKRFLNIESSPNAGFASYGVIDFQFGSVAAQPAFTTLTIALTQANASFTSNGRLNFYLSTATSASLQPGISPLVFGGNTEGTASNVASGQLALLSLGSGTFTQVNNGTENDYSFALSATPASVLASDVRTNSVIRLVVTPADAAVAATYAGSTSTTPERLTLAGAAATAVPEPATLLLLGVSAGALALRRRGRPMLHTYNKA